jgi:hypothetical protein
LRIGSSVLFYLREVALPLKGILSNNSPVCDLKMQFENAAQRAIRTFKNSFCAPDTAKYSFSPMPQEQGSFLPKFIGFNF